MVRLSSRGECAYLAVVSLAKRHSPHPVTARDIAESQAIPYPFLSQVLLKLRAAGLVRSISGAAGGYALARPPEQITLGEVLSAVNGSARKPHDIPKDRPGSRVLTLILEQAHAAERAVLDQVSIARLAELAEPHDWVI